MGFVLDVNYELAERGVRYLKKGFEKGGSIETTRTPPPPPKYGPGIGIFVESDSIPPTVIFLFNELAKITWTLSSRNFYSIYLLSPIL